MAKLYKCDRCHKMTKGYGDIHKLRVEVGYLNDGSDSPYANREEQAFGIEMCSACTDEIVKNIRDLIKPKVIVSD